MNQVKVGKYISLKRKELGLTQKALAELIDVTDKSVSKWERGNGLPDVTRLKPLCDALNVNLNELIAGEDIDESVRSQKTEENIMNLIKENENQKNEGKRLYIIGVVLTLIAVGLLGVSVRGSSAQSVFQYFDILSVLFLAVFVGIGIFMGKDKSKKGILTMIQTISIPSACFIALFQAVLILSNISDASKLGPSLATAILTPLYGMALYIVAAILRTHAE